MRVTTVIGLVLLVLGILVFLGCVDSTGPVECPDGMVEWGYSHMHEDGTLESIEGCAFPCAPTDSTPLTSVATSLHTVDSVARVHVGFCIDTVWPWLP